MTGERPRVFHLITRLLKGGAEAKTIATVRGLDGYGKFEAKASPFRAGMKPTNSIQPPTMA
jgi:hypothetical protein